MIKTINTYTKQATALVEKEDKANNNLTKIIFDIVENLALTRITALLLNEESLKTNKQFNEYITRQVYNIQGDIKESPIKSALYKKIKAVDIVTKHVLSVTPATYQTETLYTQEIRNFMQPFTSLNKLLESTKKEKIPAEESKQESSVITQESLDSLSTLANPLEALQVASNTIKLHLLDTLQASPKETKAILNDLVDFLSCHLTTLYDGFDVTSQPDSKDLTQAPVLAFENGIPTLAIGA